MTAQPLQLAQLLAPPPAPPGVLQDARGRLKRKLRLSLTDRCNFRCRYCMPERPRWLPREELLTRGELMRLAKLFVRELGITQVRLTGGEPLLRGDLTEIVRDLDGLRPLGLSRISLTTNGTRLAERIAALRDAGLDDVNVSLDARTPQTFRALTGADVAPVLRGIAAARAAGVAVKINAVVIRGYNDGEIVPLARWALDAGHELRFIEFMPLDGRGFWSADKVVPQDEILERLAAHVHLRALPRDASPATRYEVERPLRGRGGGGGTLGVIATVSNPFCASCDRVRLTATGTLFTCLFAAHGPELGALLRAGANDAALLDRIRGATWTKPAGYAAQPGYVQRPQTMHQLGG